MTPLLLLCTMAQAAPLDTLIGAEEVTNSELFGPPTSDVSVENQAGLPDTLAETQALMTWDDLAAPAATGATTQPVATVSSMSPMVMMPLGLGLLAGAWFLRRNLMGQVH